MDKYITLMVTRDDYAVILNLLRQADYTLLADTLDITKPEVTRGFYDAESETSIASKQEDKPSG